MELVEHVQECINKGEAEASKLPTILLRESIPGLSSNKVRHFLNNLCSIPKWRHLEIGSHTGSTLLAAGYKNPLDLMVAIDNFSMKPEKRSEFFSNVKLVVQNLPPIHVIEHDCWKFKNEGLGLFNTYFYDAFHSRKAQEMGITYYWKNLED